MKDLLTAISSAKVDDERGLDEIDARVMAFLLNSNYQKHFRNENGDIEVETGEEITDCVLEYTRSRDALKKIRPKGWRLEIGEWTDGWKATLWKKLFWVGETYLPTEELAELHAIIQAIQHDRANTEGGDKP